MSGQEAHQGEGHSEHEEPMGQRFFGGTPEKGPLALALCPGKKGAFQSREPPAGEETKRAG